MTRQVVCLRASRGGTPDRTVGPVINRLTPRTCGQLCQRDPGSHLKGLGPNLNTREVDR